MKIAIVCGHFMPEIGYQEVYLARAYSRLGYEARVFTSSEISPSKRRILNNRYSTGLSCDTTYNFTILRLPTFFKFGSIVLSFGLIDEIKIFDPDYVLVIGIGKVFPHTVLLPVENRKYCLINLFGDNKDYYDWSSIKNTFLSFKSKISKTIIKRWLYRRAIIYSDLIITYTPETKFIIAKHCNYKQKKYLNAKNCFVSLGFDPDEFYFSNEERNETRLLQNIEEDEIILITSSRVSKRKNFESIINSIDKLNCEGILVKYIIIGFVNDIYENILKKYIKSLHYPNNIICLPFKDHNTVRKYYCAADFGVWIKPTISIIEAMGTGLPVFIQNKKSLSHLIQESVNGWYFEDGMLNEKIKSTINNMNSTNYRDESHRKKIREMNKTKLSYNNIAQKIIDKTE